MVEIDLSHCMLLLMFHSLKIKISVLETMAELFLQVLQYLGWQ